MEGCPWLAPFPLAARQQLAQAATLRTTDRRAVLFRQGDPCPGVFVVLTGAVRILRVGVDGRELLLRQITPPGTFLEVAVLAGLACPAQAETAGPCRLACLSSATVLAVLDEHPAIHAALSRDLASRLPRLIERLDDVVLHDAVGRVARHLLRSAADAAWDDASGSWRDVAARLDLTPESVSRALRHLVEAGVLRTTSDRGYVVRDAAGLRAIAEGGARSA